MARYYFGREICQVESLTPTTGSALLGPEEEHRRIDALEARILGELPAVHLPVVHRFLPGLYVREIFMPAGTILTSRCHLTEHPYVVLSGVAHVSIPGGDALRLEGGYLGITQAGTRRALYIEADCRWATFHVLSPEEEAARTAGVPEREMLAMIEARIIGKREREDGRDMFGEYQERLASAGLPGPHDGAKALEGESGAACLERRARRSAALEDKP